MSLRILFPFVFFFTLCLGLLQTSCTNDVENLIGPLDQSDTATGIGTDSFAQVNKFGAAQHAAAGNDCDESGLGDNLALCDNNGYNTIESETHNNAVMKQVRELILPTVKLQLLTQLLMLQIPKLPSKTIAL